MPSAAPAAPPAPAPAAPKAAPAPSPNAKPPAAAKPAPTITPPKESADDFSDAFAELDSMESGKPAPKKEAAAKPPKSQSGADNPESDTAGTSQPEGQSASNADASSKEAESDTTQKTDASKPVKAAELRTAYESLKEKVKKEYEPKLAKLTQLEREVETLKKTTPELDKVQQERVAAIEKRNAELEARIRFKDYETSSDYQDNHWKPYQQAWAEAMHELKGLTMTVEDPKTGESVTREVTQADLQYFASLDPAIRRTEINRLFPDDKEEVKRHTGLIRQLHDKAEEAKKKAQAEAETHAKTQTEQQQQFQKQREQMWRQTNEALATKYPNWFNKVEGDNEGNTLFDRGTALADLAMFPQDLTPEKIEMLPKSFREAIASQKPFTQEQLVKLHSIVRNKAANHDRLAHQNKTLTARVAELEKSLKEYEASGPDGARAGNLGGEKSEPSWSEELDALERQGGR